MAGGRRLVIWRSCLLPGSETFVRLHGAALRRWRADYLGALRIDSPIAADTDVIAYPRTPAGRLAWVLLRLTGRSPALGRALARSRPALVHAHFGGDAWLVSRAAARLGVPLVITLHGLDVTRQAHRPGLRGARHRRHLRTAFDRATVILAVSEFIRRAAIDLGADPAKVRVHHTGVPMPDALPDPLPGAVPDPLPGAVPDPVPGAGPRWDVVFVGRFVEKKGLDDLVAALGMLADLRPKALFVGAGPLEAAVREQAAALGLDATFVGAQEPSAVTRHLAASRIFAAPSKTAPDGDSEGLPTTILEAAALGLPTVSTRHSGIPEAVLHGETGLLCAEGDRAALAANLRLLLGDDALRAELGRAARRHVRDHFDLRRQSLLLEDLYDEVTGLREPTPDADPSAPDADGADGGPGAAPGDPDTTEERLAQPGRAGVAE